ncbi:DUF4097 family beta strand repeat-containing protein [Actinomadura algeriensis]|uniref:DUF4097 domain-containing protein n=1 Tax=Actinomadura algeriensis TaxID=1679523 RepID=A0ABR9JQE0_9ACTN|nr:DUF4097 family beta strand repeat-containing protein [Actinomadura algeriensis]MBE1532781.1 hypothetical protein [Actinomadura algeriensis]
MTVFDLPARRTLAAAGGVLALAAALGGCGASAADAEPERRSFGPVPVRLTIDVTGGALDVRPAPVDQVRVTRRFDRWLVVGGDAGSTWRLRDGTLTLATDCNTIIGGCDVRYEVLVPERVAVAVQGENGAVTATGFRSDLKVRTDNGAITVTGAAGGLDLETQNGEVRASGSASRQVKAVSQNGEVALSFAAVPDRVRVETDNGAVKVEVPEDRYRVTTRTDNGDVRADVPDDPGGTHAIDVRTGNGSITLRTAAP